MSNLTPKSNLKFTNDFGQSPLVLGHFSKDQGFIAVASLVGAFVGAAMAGPSLAVLMLVVGLNDIAFAGKLNRLEGDRVHDVAQREITDALHQVVDQPTEQLERPGQQFNSDAESELEFIAEALPMAPSGVIDVPSETVKSELEVQPPPDLAPKPVEVTPTVVHQPQVPETLTSTKSTPQAPDIALEMAQVPKSTIIAASPRVGKGYVVSQAIANLKRLHPDLEIWLIDPKDEPTERHYWSQIAIDKRCHYDLRDFDVDAKEAIETFSDHIVRFNQSPSSRKLLIIDEFVTLSQKCKGEFMDKIKDFLVGICSSGEVNPDMGIGRFVWVITQSPYVTDLGFKTKAALATFQRVFLLNQASINLYSLAVSASFVPGNHEDQINRLMKVTGRVYYYSRNDLWHPVPNYTLPNSASDNTLRAKLEGLVSGVSDNPKSVSETPELPPTAAETTETPKRNPETLKQPNDVRFSKQDDVSLQRFTKLKLPFQDAKELVARLRNEMSQTKVIEMLWDAKPGESKAYKDAIAEYKMLTEEV